MIKKSNIYTTSFRIGNVKVVGPEIWAPSRKMADLFAMQYRYLSPVMQGIEVDTKIGERVFNKKNKYFDICLN